MRDSRFIVPVVLGCALLVIGCRGGDSLCPEPDLTAEPEAIPEGLAQTRVRVQVDGFEGFETSTRLRSISGRFDDASATDTMYTCAYDASGPVEICVDVLYEEIGSDDAREASEVAASTQSLRRPHVRLPNPPLCEETQCIDVVCPTSRNVCPAISSLTAEPEVLETDQMATITLEADDPDDGPEALTTTLSARHGTIADPSASTTTYRCDPEVGGVIEICGTASDGDPSCGEVERCTTVRCPGEPLENTCPIISSVSANPVEIPAGDATTVVSVESSDPDDFPVPLRNEWSSDSGVFEDRFASTTRFTCGESGPVELCVRANDGDPDCRVTSCLTVQCPAGIRVNLCPELFVINAIPRSIPPGQVSTRVETRGQDTDGLPLPLTLTLSTLWGSFENTENIQEPFNVVAQDATYICDRPGLAEVCVDATDGACTKTLCDTIICPDDVPTAP